MASPTQWTWVWVDSRNWWWTARPGVLRFMGSQRVGHTERLNWTKFTNTWNECDYLVVWTFFGIAFLWDWNENWPFPVLWTLLSFPNLLAYCCITFFFKEIFILGFPRGSDGKASTCNAGDLGSIPGSGRAPGEGNGNPLQHFCLENPMDRGAW